MVTIRVLDTLPVYDSKEERYLKYLRVAQENLAFETKVSEGPFKNYNLVPKRSNNMRA